MPISTAGEAPCDCKVLEVNYHNIDTFINKSFTLYLKLQITNSNQPNLELIQGIISLKGIYKGRVFMQINSSILFVSESAQSSVYHCYCHTMPLSLHNYITIKEEYKSVDLLNYYLNVQFIGSVNDSVPEIVLDKNYQLNLWHQSFTNQLDLLEEGRIETYEQFECSKEYQPIKQKDAMITLVPKTDIKKGFKQIVETGKIPSISELRDTSVSEPKETSSGEPKENSVSEPKDTLQGQQHYIVKTTNQNISIRFNKPAYSVSERSLIVSINSSRKNMLSGVSVQLFRKTKLSTAKISQKLDKFALFSATDQQPIQFKLPVSVDEPTTVNEQEYKLLVKFVEPVLEDDAAPEQFFFNDTRAMKYGTKSTLSAELTGNLGVFYIPVVFHR